MKLTDLNPRWVRHFSDGPRTGISLICPCCMKQRLVIPMIPTSPDGVLQSFGIEWPNPHVNKGRCWKRVGEDFGSMSFDPSYDARESGHWHGWIENGVVKSA